MPGEVPPTIENPKSFIGLGTRELIILAVALLLGMFIFVLPMDMVIKIFFGVLIVGLGVGVAFGRDPKTGKTLEQYLSSLISYYSRVRYQQRGAGFQPEPPLRVVTNSTGKSRPNETKKADPDRSAQAEPVRTVFPGPVGDYPYEPAGEDGIRFAPLPLGGGLLLGVISVAFLVALLAWVWLGGAAELNMLFSSGL